MISKKLCCFGLTILISSIFSLHAQSVLDHSWERVVYHSSAEWYDSDEAIRIAENVLLYQRDIGGWPKNEQIQAVLTKDKKQELLKLKTTNIGATIDNGATTTELDFLSRIYNKTYDERYKLAFLRGIDYLLEAQYENGGWPQFYPLEKGDYSSHITFNDNAMVNVMKVMKDIAEKSSRFSIEVDEGAVIKAKKAFDKGIRCILNTQYIQNGESTVWCAQHDEHTFLPVKARSYELASLSGSESAGIVLLLMSIDNPSPEIIQSINAAVKWMKKVKIKGIRIERIKDEEGRYDRRVVADESAPPMWARFYGLSDNRPFFCDRDGIKKYSLSEIGHERRNSYAWYKNDCQRVLDKYEIWSLNKLTTDCPD